MFEYESIPSQNAHKSHDKTKTIKIWSRDRVQDRVRVSCTQHCLLIFASSVGFGSFAVVSQVKSSHLYLYSAFNNTNCDKATAQYQNGKIVSIM